MRHSLLGRAALVALATFALPTPSLAQTDLVALDRVHELYVSGRSREAAMALAGVSAAFRQEIGRCKDPEIGAKLLDLEPRIDALVSRLGNGRVTNAQELTQEFVLFDRALAENHLQLAELGWSQRRNGRLDAVGRDLDLAVRYAERSVRWTQRAPDAGTRAALDAARGTAAQLIATPAQPPVDAERSLAALATVVKGNP